MYFEFLIMRSFRFLETYLNLIGLMYPRNLNRNVCKAEGIPKIFNGIEVWWIRRPLYRCNPSNICRRGNLYEAGHYRPVKRKQDLMPQAFNLTGESRISWQYCTAVEEPCLQMCRLLRCPNEVPPRPRCFVDVVRWCSGTDCMCLHLSIPIWLINQEFYHKLHIIK